VKISQLLSTFHAESFAPKAIRRREIARSLLATVLVFAFLAAMAGVILVDIFGGGWVLFER
jgi:hypothetical protein